MPFKNILTELKRYHRRLNGSTMEFDLTPYRQALNEINKLKRQFETKSDNELKERSNDLMKKAKCTAIPDSFLIEAFALVREAVNRVLKIKPFEVQIIGGIAMHLGKLAEMQTGEGKTLTAVFPAYLNALYRKLFQTKMTKKNNCCQSPVKIGSKLVF